MRIAFVTDHADNRSGTTRVVCELARRLSTRHEVHMFAGSMSPSMPEAIALHRLRVLSRPAFLKVPLFALTSTIALSREPFDFIIGQGANCFAANVVIAHQCLAAVRQHAAMSPLRRAQERLPRRVARRLHDAIACALERRIYLDRTRRGVVAVSEGLRRDLERYHPGDGGEIVAIQNGVDTAEFCPANRDRYRRATRQELGIGPDETALLFVGGDWERKGVEFAISALTHLADVRVKLVVVGPGDTGTFRGLADSLGVADRVVFTGFQSDCRPYYAAGDVFVLPTCYESFSLLLPEAAASGLPVLVTRVNGAEEFVEDGVNGFFIRQDAADIAAKVRTALSFGRLPTLSAAARRRAEQYTWDRQAQRLEEYLMRRLVEPR